MASDKQQFERALQKWEQLRAAGCISASKKIGKHAIICSYITDIDSSSEDSLEDSSTIVKFTNEAQSLYNRYTALGKKAILHIDADGEIFDDVLKDPSVSNITVIGHGALSFVYLPNGTTTLEGKNIANNRYDWRDVSSAADHLKRGIFIQRHCGHAVRNLSVPLGTFAMQSHHRVIAPVHEYFTPDSIYDPTNKLLRKVTRKRKLTRSEVLRRFSRQTFLDNLEPIPEDDLTYIALDESVEAEDC
jgi:hypothetical protein